MPIIYTAEHPALAALEILQSWKRYENLDYYTLFLARINPETVIDALPQLEEQQVSIRDLQATQAFGDAWMASRSSVALRVPSVATPISFNYLLNPDHPDFSSSVSYEAVGPFQYDPRITELIRAAKKNP